MDDRPRAAMDHAIRVQEAWLGSKQTLNFKMHIFYGNVIFSFSHFNTSADTVKAFFQSFSRNKRADSCVDTGPM